MNHYQSVFRKISNDTRALISEMNQKKEPTFILPTKYISKQAAQAGYLFNEMSNSIVPEHPQTYKSFFCNSAEEALQGAVKIVRHYGYKQYKKHRGQILIYTSKATMYPLFKGTSKDKNSLYPNIKIVNSFEALKDHVQTAPVLSIIFAVTKTEELHEIETYLEKHRGRRMVTGLDLSTLAVEELWQLKVRFPTDVIVWGEEFTNREIPFGAFSMTDTIYAPWNKLKYSLLHSSTYSGNILTLKKALTHMLGACNNSDHYEKKIEEIGASYKTRKHYFSKYVNPKLGMLYGLTGYDFDVKKAEGSYLTIEKDEKEYEVFDCVGGGGLSIFGHNPEDLTDQVINRHDQSIDYVLQLTQQLKTMTGYDRFFQTVSGASSVETAMLMGLLSQPETRQKILVFKGNYAGKLLLPLTGTQIAMSPNRFFYPIYENVVVVDPFAKDALQQMESIVQKGDIGLVWFEYLRGTDGKRIPEAIIESLEKNREQYGYHIGVDEILFGMCRTGPFMSIEATNLKPDITTLSKGLTYMTFPTGGTLIKEALWKKALDKNKEMIHYLAARYQNQIGAHIACHCLQRMEKENIAENIAVRSTQLAYTIRESQNQHIKDIEQNGLFFKIVLKKPWWVKLGIMSGFLEMLWLLRLVKKWLIKGGVFAFFDIRLFPALRMDENECSDLGNRINNILKDR